MSLTIFAFPYSQRSFKVLWCAHHLGLPFELKVVDFSKNAQNDPAYLKINPNGRAPAIDDGGYRLWESNAILEYLASLKPAAGLLPGETRARLSVSKWLYWESAHWDHACWTLAYERVARRLFGRGEPEPSEIARAERILERVGKILDQTLEQSRYVESEKLTLADISIGASLCVADEAKLPLENFRHIRRWKGELQSLPSWKKTAATRVLPDGAR